MRSLTRWAVHSLAILTLALVAAGPLGVIAFEAATGGSAPDAVASRLFGRGAALALIAGAIAVAVGGALALVGMPRRGWAALALGAAPIIVPPTVYGLGWDAVWPAPNSATLGVIRVALVMGLAFAPLAAFVGLAARMWQDPAEMEAARLANLPRALRWGRIALPGAGAAILAAGAAAFILSLAQFEIPSALNYASFPEELYARFNETYSLGPGAALSFINLAPVALLGGFIWLRLGRIPATGPAQTRFAEPRGAGWPSWAAWLAYSAVALGPPAYGLTARSFGDPAFGMMAQDLLLGLRDTAPIVVGAALFSLALGWAAADIFLRRPGVIGAPVFMLALAPAALPPAVLGVGIIRFWQNLPVYGERAFGPDSWIVDGLTIFSDQVYGRSAALGLALAARFLPIVVLIILAGRRALGATYLESARVSAVAGWRRHVQLLAPALREAIGACLLVMLALMMGELGATTMLAPPGIELLSYRLHSRIHVGPAASVSALSLMYAFSVMGVAAFAWGCGRMAGLWRRT